ncbi:MAG TPA: hypothetical protein VF280_14020 [Burkholderiales bacterium]|jgi:hypothetical protein
MLSHAAGFLLLSLSVTAAVAADGEKKAFALPDNSKLELTIPAGWKDEPKEKSIALSPPKGAPFQVVVTPVARQKPGASTDTAIKMRVSVQQGADKVKPGATEQYLPVEPLAGAPGPGYYFSATDREPKPGEFKYLTQGMLLVGDVVVGFSILTNDAQEKVRDQALAMLKSASHIAR